MGARCTANVLNPAAMPYWSHRAKPLPAPIPKASPFDDLLKYCPQAAPALPANRPKRLDYHCLRDASTMTELEKLKSGVVFNTHGNELGFSLQDVLGFATRTNKVQASEISIARLSKEKFLIMLPHGLAPETFINATGPELWDAGFTFQPWSQLDGAKMVLPEFKALLDLHDIPPHLFNESEVKKVVMTFGTFLGSVPPADPADLSKWTLVVAVHRLEKIPEELSMHDLGSEHIVPITVKNWLRSPLYKATDLPRHQPKFSKPPKKPASSEPDHFHVSRRALIQICKGLNPADLPPEVQAILSSPAAPPIIPSAQIDQLMLCQTMPHTVNPVAGQDSCSNDSAHTIIASQIHQPSSSLNPSSSAGQPLNSDIGNGTQMGSTTPIPPQPMPQKNQQPIQILRRPDIPPVTSPIPKHCNPAGEGSARKPCTDFSRQNRGSDKPPKSRVWTRVAAEVDKDKAKSATIQAHKDKGKATVQSTSKPAQKPKKGNPILIPPKPVLFKKMAQQQFTGRNKPKAKQAQKLAEVNLGQEGFYEVKVQYAHKENLAAGCGLQTYMVIEALNEDNLQRRVEMPSGSAIGNMDLDNEGLDLNFDSEEELGSEEDLE